MIKLNFLFYCLFVLNLVIFNCNAQDPFYAHFYGNESVFNPALVGFKGALSLSAKYKNQWNSNQFNGFKTTQISIEESVPCSYFDYGLNMNWDQEGDGLLTTIDAGFRIAGTVAFPIGQAIHNLRFGTGLQWSNKWIDYSRFIFSDELDPKYGYKDAFGNDLKSQFVPPNDGRSLVYFTPSFGFAHRILFNKNDKNSATLNYGLSFHNFYSLGKSNVTGNVESILGTNTKIPTRYGFFANYEFIALSTRNSFISFKPLIVFEQQQNIHYFEIGNRFSINRNLGLGIYYHFNNQSKQGWNTNWFTINAELGKINSRHQRFDFGLSYSDNLTGVRNYLGAIVEISVAIHFASSPSCKLIGKGDKVPYSYDTKCPYNLFSLSKRKLYENIWFKSK